MSDFERYEHSVLDVSSQLVGFISGTFVGLSQSQMYVRAAWLDWRIADAQWRHSRFGVGEEHEYEAIVRDLARAALRCFRANCGYGGVSNLAPTWVALGRSVQLPYERDRDASRSTPSGGRGLRSRSLILRGRQ